MAKRQEVPPPVDPRRTDTLELPNGRVLEHGDEFTVAGEGRYRFSYGWKGSEATSYGPIDSKEPKWRTFRANAITRIHRKKISRTAAEQETQQ